VSIVGPLIRDFLRILLPSLLFIVGLGLLIIIGVRA